MSRFAIVPIEAALDDRLSKTELRVLIAILSFADKDGVCWPKREQISERCGLSLSKISTATTSLVKLGWLDKKGDGGCSRASHYQILNPISNVKTVPDSGTVPNLVTVPDSGTKTVPDSGTVPNLVTVPDSGTKTVPDSGTKTVPDSGTRIKQTNEQTNEQTNLYCSFDAFWAVYPRKVAKHKARLAWGKLAPCEDLTRIIIEAVKKSLLLNQNWIKDGGAFIPHPATYLNGKRWEDEITQAPQGGRNEARNYSGYTSRRDHAARIGGHLDKITAEEFGQGVGIGSV